MEHIRKEWSIRHECEECDEYMEHCFVKQKCRFDEDVTLMDMEQNIVKFLEFQKEYDRKFDVFCSIIMAWTLQHGLKMKKIRFRS